MAKAECSVTGGAHVVEKSARDRAEGGKGGRVTCTKCGKKLRLKPSGDSIKGEVKSSKQE